MRQFPRWNIKTFQEAVLIKKNAAKEEKEEISVKRVILSVVALGLFLFCIGFLLASLVMGSHFGVLFIKNLVS